MRSKPFFFFVGALSLLSFAASITSAADSIAARSAAPPDARGIASSSTTSYTSSGLGRTAEFPGRIVVAGDRYALRVDGEDTVHPLLILGSPPLLGELRSGALIGREVTVTGVHYPSSGAILVNSIHPRG